MFIWAYISQSAFEVHLIRATEVQMYFKVFQYADFF